MSLHVLTALPGSYAVDNNLLGQVLTSSMVGRHRRTSDNFGFVDALG